MPSALILGIQLSAVQRIEAALRSDGSGYAEGWKVDYIPAFRRGKEIRGNEVKAALRKAEEMGGAHVMGFSKQDGKLRKVIARSIKPYFRFRWLHNSAMSLYGKPSQFVDFVNSILEEEEVWIQKVRPSDERSPLLLPEPCFAVPHPLRLMWSEAAEYGSTERYEAIERRVEEFRDAHWYQVTSGARQWKDARSLVFSRADLRQRHGAAPHPRGFKYSYAIPEGFHYDVTHEHGSKFKLIDMEGKEHRLSANGYINIYPHGYARGG